MEKVERPKAEKRKIHCRNEFELCYLRHQYLRKVDYNPTEAEMKPYMAITANLAKNTFYTYRNLFGSVGMEIEDLVSIGRIHLISFLGLFALDKMPEKEEAFVLAHVVKHNKQPEGEDFLNKNKANFTLFLKQRFGDVVRVCRQKVRNIKGGTSDEFAVFFGSKKPPKILPELLRDHEAHGYKKIDIAVFKTIRKRVKAHGANIFKFAGYYYVAVKQENRALDLLDFSGAGLDPYDSIHNMSPERIFTEQQDANFWENKRVEFDTYPPRKKVRLIKTFINQFKNKKNYEEEVRVARKLLRSVEARL